MTELTDVDFGPLQGLIGVWKGAKGMDVAPEPDKSEEHSPYFETITVEPVGTVDNAETQTLAVLFYRLIAQRESNGEVFHDQTGYWMWDADAQTVIYSLTIPRAVSVLAGGKYDASTQGEGVVSLNVAADCDNPDWQIIQSPFMRDNAKTTAYQLDLMVKGDELSYQQTTVVDIYGKVFNHTDANSLVRQ